MKGRTCFSCEDYKNMLALTKPGDLVYMDPPYQSVMKRMIKYYQKINKMNNYKKPGVLPGFLYEIFPPRGSLLTIISGPEGNRTPVRKSIPCSSTIIVCYLPFPPPSESRHPDGFSSFILRPQAQSFACVVSCIVDARFSMCRCKEADNCLN